MPCQATANLAVDIWVRAWSGLCADEIEFASLFLLLALLGLYLVGELTHMRSMCVGVAETGVGASTTRYLVGANIVRPRRYLKKLFFFSRFSLTKRMVQGGEATSERRRRDGVSGKSHLRGFSILLKIFFPVSATPTNALRALVHSRVHELVARAMRGE